MTTAPSLAVVMLHWGDERLTKGALESLRNANYPALKIFLVNQGSDLDIPLGPETVLVRVDANTGFCAGNNRAIELAVADDPDYVMLLNNDTLTSPAAIDRLIGALESSPTAAAAGPTVVEERPSGRTWFGKGVYVENQGRAFTTELPDGTDQDALRTLGAERTDYLAGCALVIRTSALRTIGSLDERYFMYWEDADWSRRAIDRGYELLYVPSAVIAHIQGEDRDFNSPRRLYYFFRNWLLFIRSHTSRRSRPRAYANMLNRLLREVVKVFARYRRSRRQYLMLMGRSILDNVRRRYGALPAE